MWSLSLRYGLSDLDVVSLPRMWFLLLGCGLPHQVVVFLAWLCVFSHIVCLTWSWSLSLGCGLSHLPVVSLICFFFSSRHGPSHLEKNCSLTFLQPRSCAFSLSWLIPGSLGGNISHLLVVSHLVVVFHLIVAYT